MFTVPSKVDYLLENYTLEEVLEMSDLSPEEALTFLFDHGFIDLEFLTHEDYDDSEEGETD
ncbi:MAG: hypothetical protein ACWGQW_21560 [bacterium]